jgi:17beta-estradiol 17-dehydrogenase / very-long-chain 3-oxoacyl-CoA reductase
MMDFMKTFNQVFLAVGLYVGIKYLLEISHGIYARLIRPGKNLFKKYGKWAIVTGATDGIGAALAMEFARKGMSVVLISRTPERLNNTAAEITAKYPKVEVKTIAIDYSNFDEAARSKVVAGLQGLEIGVLVNNVGMSYPFTKYFHELKDEEVAGLMSLNVDSTTWMTKIVLPSMLARKKGAIVNVASFAGLASMPLLAQYGAAKSYIVMFTKGLNAELKGKGIDVHCHVPLFVTTKLAKIRKTSLFVPSPRGYASAAIAAIGYETIVSPYWSHALQIYVLMQLPEFLFNLFVFMQHQGIRAAGMKKEARAAAEKSKSQ